MTAFYARTSRAEQVRRRRLAQSRRRFEAVARSGPAGASAAPTRVRPLVSRPRRDPNLMRPRGGRGFSLRGTLLYDLLLDLPRLRPSWRLASLVMVVLLGGMLARLLTDPAMYVNGVNLGGAALVPGEEIYESSGIAGQHIFWVNPEEVKRNIEAVPGIAGASVSVEWPNTVTILVSERIPVVTWLEGGQTWWVDADGTKFEAREDLPGLLPIQVDNLDGKSLDPENNLVPAEAIQGALQLRELRPNIELLHYDTQYGLSYQDGRGWRGYFGVGTDMPQKLAVYERLTEDLVARGIYPKKISVENPYSPYYQR